MINRMKLINRGMGAFLNPPNHPEHNWCFDDGEEGSANLSYGLAGNWIPDNVKAEARKLLDDWEKNKLPLTHPDVIKWVRGVLAYYKYCYSGNDNAGNQSWNADKLRVEPDISPMLNADIHAGVNLIRKYYPEFVPTQEDFDNPELWA